MAACPPFVRRDHQLQMGDPFRWNRPLFALKGRAWWTEGILLAQQCLVSVSPVSRDCYLEFLCTAHIPFLDLEAEHAQGLWSIEGQEQSLWPRRFSDPAAPPGTAAAVKNIVNRISGGF